jgi:hypothetical protein
LQEKEGVRQSDAGFSGKGSMAKQVLAEFANDLCMNPLKEETHP